MRVTVLVVALAVVGAYGVVAAVAAIVSWGRRVHGWQAAPTWLYAAPVLAAGYWAFAGLSLAFATAVAGSSGGLDVSRGQGTVLLAVYAAVMLTPLAWPIGRAIERRWRMARGEQLSLAFGIASVSIPVLLVAGGVLGIA